VISQIKAGAVKFVSRKRNGMFALVKLGLRWEMIQRVVRKVSLTHFSSFFLKEKTGNVHGNTNLFLLSLVHPCDTVSKGGCSQICNKKGKRYECNCEDGFVLGVDKQTCNKG